VAEATAAAAAARLRDAVSVTAGAVQEQLCHGVSGSGCGADASLRRCSGCVIPRAPAGVARSPCTLWRTLPPASSGPNRQDAVAARRVNHGRKPPPTRLAAAARGPGVGGVYAALSGSAGGRL